MGDEKAAGKKSGSGEPAGRKTGSVQIERDLARMAAVIAAHERISVSDLLSPQIREFLTDRSRQVKESIECALVDRSPQSNEQPGGELL